MGGKTWGKRGVFGVKIINLLGWGGVCSFRNTPTPLLNDQPNRNNYEILFR